MLRTLKASERICLKGVSPRVLACSASLHSGSAHSPWESIQHAGSLCEKAPGQDSHRLSPCGHSRGWKPISHRSPASTFLRPFAPQALPRFPATMDALTPARLALRHTSHEHQPFSEQVSLVHMTRPSLHSVTNHLTRPAIAFQLPAQRDRLPEPGLRPATPMPCRGLANLWQTSCSRPCSGLDFALHEEAHRHVRPNRVRHPTDCRFVSSCSPPRLTATQLPLTIGSEHLPREDLHLSDRACFQAHSCPRRRASRLFSGFPLRACGNDGPA
jgi:hypothetical protein